MLRDTSERQSKALFPGNFGALRLILALLVVVGHTPELIDGHRDRELLTNWFDVMSFGEFSVDGFFLISGYMLALSVVKSGSLKNYFIKRVARIYPAFIVSFFLCLLVVNPLAGGALTAREFLSNMIWLIFLKPPESATAFAGAPHPALNGAMWTISYEFFCYVLLAVLFSLGLLRRTWLLVALSISLNILLVTQPHLNLAIREITFGGGSQNTLRFVAAFCTGVGYRQVLRPAHLKGWLAILCLCILPFTLSHRSLAEPSLILLGGYLLVYVGEARIGQSISKIGQNIDLSYGIYLYAWPMQNLIIWKFGLTSVIQVDVLAAIGSGFLAFWSWTLVERPAMRAAISYTRQRGSGVTPGAAPLVVEDAGAP